MLETQEVTGASNDWGRPGMLKLVPHATSRLTGEGGPAAPVLGTHTEAIQMSAQRVGSGKFSTHKLDRQAERMHCAECWNGSLAGTPSEAPACGTSALTTRSTCIPR